MSEATDNGFVTWVIAGIAAILGVLTSTVAYLFKVSENANAQAIKELKDSNAHLETRSTACEKDRNELFAKCAVLEEKVSHLDTKLKSIDKEGTQFSHQLDHKL